MYSHTRTIIYSHAFTHTHTHTYSRLSDRTRTRQRPPNTCFYRIASPSGHALVCVCAYVNVIFLCVGVCQQQVEYACLLYMDSRHHHRHCRHHRHDYYVHLGGTQCARESSIVVRVLTHKICARLTLVQFGKAQLENNNNRAHFTSLYTTT